jgi:L-aminopeptidase/D-esterase-like protein
VSAAPGHRVKPAAPRQAPTITGLLGVGRGGRAGARVAGTGSSARTSEVLAAVMTLAALALALLAVLRLALALLGRHRLAAWETAWSRVGPRWSKHRP